LSLTKPDAAIYGKDTDSGFALGVIKPPNIVSVVQ